MPAATPFLSLLQAWWSAGSSCASSPTPRPYLRDAIFTPVSQMALAQSAMETFAHALSLSLNFHQGKQTGGLARIIDRGARSTDFLLRSVVFNLGPDGCSSWSWPPMC